jgi:3-oxoacyl-[acyl-carrier-protein] synthase II
MAWSTALGSGLEEVWAALHAGASGIRPTPCHFPLRSELGAAVPGLDGLHPQERQLALTRDTLAAALDDAGLEPSTPGITSVLGTSYGAHLDWDPDDGALSAGLGAWADASATGLGMAEPPLSVTTACSSGSDSLLLGAELIRSGTAQICVCGGADILTTAKRLGHSALGTLSPTGLTAFDTARDGTVLGEGAGFLVLESPSSARRRGARLRGFLTGAGSANDGTSPTAPDPGGRAVVAAVERALRDADASAGDVAVINAHGSGTPVNDDVEATALRTVFAGAGSPTVFATKGAFGHSMGATGALEAIATLLALRDRTVPPVAGLRTVLDGFPLPLARESASTGPGIGLSLTLGFGGFDTCLAFAGAPRYPPTRSSPSAPQGRRRLRARRRARGDPPGPTAPSGRQGTMVSIASWCLSNFT